MRIAMSRRRLWQAAVVLLVVVVGPYLVGRAASPLRCLSHRVDTGRPSSPARRADGTLRLATYNIAHGRGTADSNWRGGDRSERACRLDRIAELLRNTDADVIVLNEVDFDASWSGSVNQAEYLAEAAGYTHWVEQRNIDVRLLHWKFRFGNALLSKHPIDRVELVPLPGCATWETWLAGKKNAMDCDVRVGEHTVRIIGTHLESRSEPVRVRSARVISDAIRKSDRPVFVLGDLNSTPPGFPYAATDQDGDNAIAVLDATGYLQRHAQLDRITERDLTFPSVKPRSIIDWILVPHGFQILEYAPIDTQLSDHRPVIAVVRNGPRTMP